MGMIAVHLKALYAYAASARTTGTIAVASVVSPFWLPDLASVSSLAAQLMPIFGCAWLSAQILTTLLRRRK